MSAIVGTTVNALYALVKDAPEEWEVLFDGSWRKILSVDPIRVVLGEGVPTCRNPTELLADVVAYFLAARRVAKEP